MKRGTYKHICCEKCFRTSSSLKINLVMCEDKTILCMDCFKEEEE